MLVAASRGLILLLVKSCLASVLCVALLVPDSRAQGIDLKPAVVVVRGGERPAAEQIAPSILVEEVAQRTGVSWPIFDQPPQQNGVQIYLANAADLPAWKDRIPARLAQAPVLGEPEAYTIGVVPSTADVGASVFVVGADARGVMFGVGHLLRRLRLLPGRIELAASLSVATAPDRRIRGHQIGYRPRANSWDAWTLEQFDQYFRDMVVFGANAMENIPFQDGDPGPLMKYTRPEMNIHFARLCARYDLDHWVWLPIQFDVTDQQQADDFLARQTKFYQACPRLDHVFVPGGDPGHNPAAPLMPYLQRMALALQQHHPQAKVWLSLQGFRDTDIDDFYEYVNRQRPAWLGGVVMGPSSPPLETTRRRLPAAYRLRWYPDITHIVRCQYPIPWLDPAWGITIGREGVNPRPEDYAVIYRNDYRFTDGFVSYSDGIHDDFNKQLWTQLAWDPDRSIREVARDYARYFFRSDLDEIGADGLFALERNLRGPAATNGSVEGTLRLWQQIEDKYEEVGSNWRLEMHLFRAYYDAYTRQRQIYESQLEQQALALIEHAPVDDIPNSAASAVKVLGRAVTNPCRPDLLARIEQMADSLFESIGYQTSVPKYQASGYERGCMLDYVNYPLNNRWWLENQLQAVLQIKSPQRQQARLDQIVGWEDPGEGGFYDVLGHVGRSPRMLKVLDAGDASRLEGQVSIPTQRNMGIERNNIRLAWHTYHDRLPKLVYAGLDPSRRYLVRLFAQRQSPLLIDGHPARLIGQGATYDQVRQQEFEVPAEAVRDGRIELTWRVLDQRHLNWREYHYVTDIWVIPQRGESP